MSWRKARLDSVADLCLGKMLDQNKNRGEMLPYLANVDVRWGEFDLADLRQMRFESHEMDRYGLKFGDIVMCEGGEPGRCALWKDQMPGLMIQKALHRIRPHDGLDNRFLYYTFLHKGRSGGFGHLFTGATIKHLPGQSLAKLEVEYPEPVVQKRIAAILSAYDEEMENNRRRMGLLEKAARLLYEEWFVRLRFPGHEHTPITHGLPHGWERKQLGDILTLQRGHDLPEQNRVPGSIPIVSSSGITGFHNTKKCDPPGVVTGRYGTLGEVYFLQQEYWPLNTALYVRDFKGTPLAFAAYTLKHLLRDRPSDKAAVPGLDRNVAHQLSILWPTETLRDQFNETAMLIYRQVDVLDQLNQKLRAARDLLLPRLMSGEIEV